MVFPVEGDSLETKNFGIHRQSLSNRREIVQRGQGGGANIRLNENVLNDHCSNTCNAFNVFMKVETITNRD